MALKIDYYLSLNSPWTYLGAARFARMAQDHGADVRVKPVDFGKIFPASGGLPLPKRAPQRQAYRLVELGRWSEHLGLPVTLHPRHFPTPETLKAGVVIAADQLGGAPLALSQAILTALWAEDRDTGDPEVLREIAEATGHDGEALLAMAADPATQELYHRLSEEALAAGVFGAPSYIVEGEIFWGQHRLDFLERRLARG